MGLTTVPASAACTLFRMRISPVRRFTATRNPCTLNATERGVPSEKPASSSGAASPASSLARSARAARRVA